MSPPTFPTGVTGQIEPKPGDPRYVSVEQSALKQLQQMAQWRKDRGEPPTKLDLEIEAGKTKLWSE